MTDTRVQHGPITLALSPDGRVYCEADRTVLGVASTLDTIEILTSAIDTHIAAEHTTLDGAGTPPAEGETITTPAAFAAHWNRLDGEQRTDLLAGIATSARTASRCRAMNHDGYREQTELLLRRTRKIRDTVDLLANGGADRTEYGAGQEALADEILRILEDA